MKMVVLQYGARRQYAVPKIFFNADRLEKFYTDVYANQGVVKLLNFIPGKFKNSRFKKMLARIPQDIEKKSVYGFNIFGIYLNLKWARAKTPTAFTSCYLMMGKGLSNRVIKKGLKSAKGVYGFNGECLELLQYAKKQGLKTILDQTIIPKETEIDILNKEFEKYPDWEIKPEKDLLLDEFISRQHEEWKYADVIVCGSEFVKEKIIELNEKPTKIRVVPTGFKMTASFYRKIKNEGKLNILCVGEVSLRKGVPYYYNTAKRLKARMNFRLIGASKLISDKYNDLKKYIEVFPSIPRNELSNHYSWADIFVLPSLSEGSAMVCYEALNQGLPVITTINAGSVVRDGLDGFIIPACEANSIVDKLELLDKDRIKLYEISTSAHNRSLEYDLNNYQNRLLDSLKDIIN